MMPPAAPQQAAQPHWRLLGIALLCVLLAVLAGCASRSGGYYKDDGPGSRIPPDIASIPDAVPRIERHAPANFRPYDIFGVRYTPIAENQAYRQEGIASWYGRKFHGAKTANGETYDMYAMTAAHPTLPIPSYARVTSKVNGRSVTVRINDRGPFHPGRIIDLSYVAAAKLGLIGPGSGRVTVQAITNANILAGNYPGASGSVAAIPVSSQPAAQPIAAPPATTRQAGLMAASPMMGNGIYLQFGAFSSADNAQALAQRVNTQMDSTLGQAIVSHQPPLYKVLLGPFASRDHAHQTAGTLASNVGFDPVVALIQGL
ncbi:septal ring lytic transglycosylase RlpA family protein [Castellaniella sp.]|uniref:septal ring lytic transglycosylase RlpA family protein n=1 Tax=Castellaniella sp. TaxID=1955812 RepID=UPI002AFF76C2|nr:septal ring lytic transglycosylase RlpA family protein [Castellaniella sp.]